MASIGLAAFLFSCSCGGKVEYSKNMMESEIDAKLNKDEIIATYAKGKHVKEVITSGDERKETKYIIPENCYIEDETEGTYIDLDPEEGGAVGNKLCVLDRNTLKTFPNNSTHFYKVKDEYLVTVVEGSNNGEFTFGKNFVCTTMKGTVDGQNMTVTFTLLDN